MIYLGIIVFALFVGVYLIDDSFVTEQDKWLKFIVAIEKFLLSVALIIIVSMLVF